MNEKYVHNSYSSVTVIIVNSNNNSMYCNVHYTIYKLKRVLILSYSDA